jgi:hypothetical protein
MTSDLVPAMIVPSDLDPKMERAALALAYRFSQKAAGKLAGVEDRTIRRWLTNPEFVALVATYRARATYQLHVELEGTQLEAVATLQRLLRDGPPAVQLGAARTLLDAGRKSREELFYQRRAAALEEQVAGIELDGDS